MSTIAAQTVARTRPFAEPGRAGPAGTEALHALGDPPDDDVMARAEASWQAGDIDGAAVLLDGTADDGDPAVATLLSAVWAARAMMPVAADIAQRAGDDGALATAGATQIAAGRLDAPPAAAADTAPTTLGIALAALTAGLRSSLEPEVPADTLSELARASRLYTCARAATPVPELPAVIAAAAAVGLGELPTATAVIDAAVAEGQGGAWARRRLLLWQAWLAVQCEQPGQAQESLRAAQEIDHAFTPRDRFIETAVRVALTRRYEEVAELELLWAQVRNEVQQIDVDLFLLLPLATMISAVARIGDDRTLAPLQAEALDLLARLGSPPAWSAHLRWAGIQQGILLDHPDMLAPHAHALVEAAAHSAIAATMARAGRLWTAVLAGHVDPDAVELSATELAECGLAWDGARLAGHGAARSDDRRVSARLLACARHLHPPTPTTPAAAPAESSTPAPVHPAGLSDREIEVARLVVEGRTYAEIGAAIFISPRTVEHHIARIRQRLQATTRSDLVARLRVVLTEMDAAQAATAEG
ncbi:LuxR C-terminal-related transcriptional regulator [Microbacterium horticulturae]|uniref:LuxR C-terminal-related transcriptional regulator n=1 Tax=Microbacterium horticulturae TaxID=3028316 RepID=A0ABY8BVB7_9MICO|nr:LuxR C-terminal-related transcriptional regulator [Microbacterium sp. KACC 23027]WEG08114.1 LuxR C-terminal-related transcriptional regulator [Microbacterium sp. KACC 23027]